MPKTLKSITATDATDATATESASGDDYVLADEDDNFSLSQTSAEGVAVYGKHQTATPPWNLSWTGKIVTSKIFKRAVIILIVLNSISIALSTMDWVRDFPQRKLAFSIVNAAFLIAFTAELFVRFLYAGPKFFSDGWCIFDLLVISSSWMVYPLLALRTFRLVRSLRLATRVRDLQYITQALLAAVPKMLCICFLLAMQFYTFTIIFTALFKDLYKDGYTSSDYFGRLDTTCLTLFQILTLDSWGQITQEAMQAHSWAWFPPVLFIMSSTFFVLNLIIAIMCEAVSKVARERQLRNLGRQVSIPNVTTDETFGSAVAIKTDTDVLRLEKKLDKLTKQVELLLKLRTHTSDS